MSDSNSTTTGDTPLSIYAPEGIPVEWQNYYRWADNTFGFIFRLVGIDLLWTLGKSMIKPIFLMLLMQQRETIVMVEDYAEPVIGTVYLGVATMLIDGMCTYYGTSVDYAHLDAVESVAYCKKVSHAQLVNVQKIDLFAPIHQNKY